MKNLLLIIFSVLASAASFAQNVPPPIQHRGGAPPPGLPVDQYVIGLFIIGMAIAFKYKKSILKN